MNRMHQRGLQALAMHYRNAAAMSRFAGRGGGMSLQPRISLPPMASSAAITGRPIGAPPMQARPNPTLNTAYQTFAAAPVQTIDMVEDNIRQAQIQARSSPTSQTVQRIDSDIDNAYVSMAGRFSSPSGFFGYNF